MCETINERKSPDTSVRKSVFNDPDWSFDYDTDSSEDDIISLEDYLNDITDVYESVFTNIVYDKNKDYNLNKLYEIVENIFDQNISIDYNKIQKLVYIMNTFCFRTQFSLIEHEKCINQIFENIENIDDVEKDFEEIITNTIVENISKNIVIR